jgi:hypothetical protein
MNAVAPGNWDGKVLGCCINTWIDFGGNAFRDGLTASLNTEQIQYAQAMLLGRAPRVRIYRARGVGVIKR